MGAKNTVTQLLESHRRPHPYLPKRGSEIAAGAGEGLGPDAAQGDPLGPGVVADRDPSGPGAGYLWQEGHADAAARPRSEGAATVRRHGVVVTGQRDAP